LVRTWKSAGFLYALIVTALAIVSYLNSADGEFVWSDRTIIVEENGILHSADDLVRAFTGPPWTFAGAPTDKGGYYRPISAISFTLDHLVYGDWTIGYHAVNILLHGANTLLLFLFLTAIFPERKTPFLAALLFAVHPIHTEAVAWISGRAGLLAAFGILLALLFHTYSRRRPLWLAGSLLAFLFALGSKEEAIVLPFLIVLLDTRSERKGGGKQGWKRALPYFVVAPLYLLLRYSAIGTPGTGAGSSIAFDVLFPTMLRVLGNYLQLLIIPFPQHTNDAVLLSQSPFDPRAFFALLFLGAAFYGMHRLGRGRREIPFGVIWMGVTILPFLNILPLLHFRAERMLYLPSIGFVLVAAALIDNWGGWLVGKEKRFGLDPAVLVTAGVAVLLCLATLSRNEAWQSDQILFSDTLKKNEFAPEAAYRLGAAAYRHGAYPDAIQLLRTALMPASGYVRFLPDSSLVLTDLGYAHHKSGDYASAVPAFRRALARRPGMERADFGLAISLGALGEREAAVEIYRNLIEIDSTHLDARYNLALELESLGALDEAEMEYRKIIRFDPERKETYTNLGSVLAQSGRLAEALENYQKALDLAPEDPRLHFNVGLLFARGGQFEPASYALEEALRLDPEYRDAMELQRELLKLDSLKTITDGTKTP